MSNAVTFAALGFGPDWAADGERVRVHIGATALSVARQPAADPAGATPVNEIRASYSALRVTAGGFDHQQMLITWDTPEGTYSLAVNDENARHTLLAHAPETLQPALSQFKRRTRRTQRGFKLGWGILGLVFLAPVLLLLLFWMKSDSIASWGAAQISVAQEEQLGEVIFAQQKMGLKLIDKGILPTTIQDMGNRLTKGSAFTYKWYVADNPQINAFAMPGGYIVVYTGLIKAADSAEEVAGVLAHEVQHVEQRHVLRGMLQSLGWQALMSIVLGDFSGTLGGELATQLGSLKFSRDKETEADMKGLEALRAARIDPQGMVTFFDKLSRQQAGGPPALFSTHPASEERMTTLKQAVQKMGGWQSVKLPYDWALVKRGG